MLSIFLVLNYPNDKDIEFLCTSEVIAGKNDIIRNGFMPHIMGHKLSHIYAREVRWNFEFDSWYSSKICSCLSKKIGTVYTYFFDNVNFKRWCTSKNFPFYKKNRPYVKKGEYRIEFVCGNVIF